MAVASAGPYTSLHLTVDTGRQITMPTPHHSVFLQAGCPSCRPTNSVKALKAQFKSKLTINHCFCFFQKILSDYIAVTYEQKLEKNRQRQTLMMAFVASLLSDGWCRMSSSTALPRLLAVSPSTCRSTKPINCYHNICSCTST